MLKETKNIYSSLLIFRELSINMSNDRNSILHCMYVNLFIFTNFQPILNELAIVTFYHVGM